MKYYELMIDSKINYRYKLNDFVLEELENGELYGVVNFTGLKDALPDLINYKKDFFASKDLKKVIEMYSYDLNNCLVMFNDIKNQVQKEYYKIDFPSIKSLSSKSTFKKDNSIENIVIDFNKVRDYPAFTIKEVEKNIFSKKHIIVNLDVVESILRRRLWGMSFKEVQVDK